jgi:hypothetical protein
MPIDMDLPYYVADGVVSRYKFFGDKSCDKYDAMESFSGIVIECLCHCEGCEL